MAVEITFNQPGGAGAGTPGKARNDVWLDVVVQCTSTGTGSSWVWELLDRPKDSTALLAGVTSVTATFTPDIVGTYRIRLTIDGLETVTKVVRARYDNTGALASRGWALPAVDEDVGEADYGTNERHWAEVWETIMADILAAVSNAGVSTLVYQPGGTASGNVYTDWVDLMADLVLVQGPRLIELDSTFGICSIPSGVHDLGYNTVLRGRYATLVMEDGAVFQNPVILEGFIELYSSSASSVFSWTGPRYLVLRDSVNIYGNGAPAPSAPLISTPSSNLYLYGQCGFYAGALDQPVLDVSSGSSSIRLFDNASINNTDFLSDSYALSCSGTGTIEVDIYDQSVFYRHTTISGLTTRKFCIRQKTLGIVKSAATNSTNIPTATGAVYLDQLELLEHSNLKVLFRIVLATTNATPGYEAYTDLYDLSGVVSGGSPAIVAGSQISTGTGNPPPGGPTPNALVMSGYQVDITSAFLGGSWTGPGVFEVRLWLGTSSGVNAASCESAEIIFEW